MKSLTVKLKTESGRKLEAGENMVLRVHFLFQAPNVSAGVHGHGLPHVVGAP